MTILLLLLLSTNGTEWPIHSHHVDVVEVNTTYRQDEWRPDRLVEAGTWVIWWEWCPVDLRYRPVDWREYAQCSAVERTPRGWQTFADYSGRGIEGAVLRVTATAYWRTHTMFDPERLYWSNWPEVARRRLR
jgi:hypothetical protein